MSRLALLPVTASFAALALACGGGGSAPKASSSPSVPTFTFSATGLSPPSLAVPNGGCVLVQNSDSSPHVVSPDDLQTCPELIGSTTLDPGHDWDWCGFKGGPKTCSFHDASRTAAGGAPDPAFSATIQVSAP